jgi:hypothetical protein
VDVVKQRLKDNEPQTGSLQGPSFFFVFSQKRD